MLPSTRQAISGFPTKSWDRSMPARAYTTLASKKEITIAPIAGNRIHGESAGVSRVRQKPFNGRVRMSYNSLGAS